MASPKGSFYRNLGIRLREARKSAGVSQETLARLVGLSRPSIVNIEKGRQPVYVHSLMKISGVLGTTLESLIPGPPSDTAAQGVADPRARQWFETLNANPGDPE